jgi:hypothetical protein
MYINAKHSQMEVKPAEADSPQNFLDRKLFNQREPPKNERAISQFRIKKKKFLFFLKKRTSLK